MCIVCHAGQMLAASYIFSTWFCTQFTDMHSNGTATPLLSYNDAFFFFPNNHIMMSCRQVYHLEGGILKYLEEVPKTESLWEGECFVFDKRVSVEHGLIQGSFKLCYGCKKPVSDEEMEAREWEYGVSCPYCFSSKSEEEKERARARQRQFETWGVIGGPDKGRRNPTTAENGTRRRASQLSK